MTLRARFGVASSSRIRPADDQETSRNDEIGWGIESAKASGG
jgi:hypothetical protein